MVRNALAVSLLAIGLAVLLAPNAQANGVLVASSPGDTPPDRPTRSFGPVHLEEHVVRATLRDRVLDVVVEQVFRNHSGRQLEGTYLFPLPEGAAVSGFAMTMGGKFVQGEVIEAGKARQIYNSIVRRRRDPGLLEFVGRGLYRARIFPIPARGTVTIRLKYQQVVPATSELQNAAVAWLESQPPRGGTNLADGLRTALDLQTSDRLSLVVLLTDGRPSIGRRDVDVLTARALKDRVRPPRVFTFGVGEDLDVGLLDRVAEAGRGRRDYVAPGEDIEIVTGRFFRQVDEPLLTDVHVDLGPGVYDVYPQHIPDLYAGGQVVLFGRYHEGGARTIRLTGRRGEQAVVKTYEARLAAAEAAGFLPRLWAQRKVAFLLDAIRLNGTDKELVDEVVRLATRYAIVTPYTAGLVVEERELGRWRVSSANPLFQIGGPNPPGRAIPPGQREPTDPTPPPPTPPSGTPTTPMPVPTPGTPIPSTTPKVSKDLRKRKEASSEVDDVSTRTLRERVRTVAGSTFILRRDGRWVDTTWDGKRKTTRVEAFSDAWQALIEKDKRIGKILALGSHVVFIWKDVAYEVVPPKD